MLNRTKKAARYPIKTRPFGNFNKKLKLSGQNKTENRNVSRDTDATVTGCLH